MNSGLRAAFPAPSEIGYSMTAFVEVRRKMRRGERRPPVSFGAACHALWALAAGYTQEQAAQLLDLNADTVGRIRRRETHPGAYPVPLGIEPRRGRGVAPQGDFGF